MKKEKHPSERFRIYVSLPEKVYTEIERRAKKKGMPLATEARAIICQTIAGDLNQNSKENAMQIEKISNNFYEVLGAPIRGFDWKMIRKPGVGTYAVIAGEDENAEDDQVVIEEYSAPESRSVWDKMSVVEAAGAAYRELKKEYA